MFLKRIVASAMLSILLVAPICAENTQKNSYLHTAVSGVQTGLGCYGSMVVTDLVHELGHAVPAKILFNSPIKIMLGESDLTKKVFPDFSLKAGNHFLAVRGLSPLAGACAHLPIQPRVPGFGLPLVYLAGPCAGIGASYAMLKGLNMWESYQKTGNFNNAWKDGMKKPALESDYNLVLTGMVFHNIWTNVSNLVPAQGRDGQKFLESLWCTEKLIARLKIPAIGASVGIAGALGKQVYDLYKNKTYQQAYKL